MTTSMPAKLLEVFIKGDGSKNDLYEYASQQSKEFVRGIQHNQLRNLLDNVIWAKQSHVLGDKKLSDETLGRVATIRPRLAYMAARQPALKPLQGQLDPILKDAIKTPNDLNRLYDYVAALVAYHKFWSEEQSQQSGHPRR